jgi:hypothetical protein
MLEDDVWALDSAIQCSIVGKDFPGEWRRTKKAALESVKQSAPPTNKTDGASLKEIADEIGEWGKGERKPIRIDSAVFRKWAWQLRHL